MYIVKHYPAKKEGQAGKSYFSVDGNSYAIDGDYSSPEKATELQQLFAGGRLEPHSVFPYNAPREWTVDGVAQVHPADHAKAGQVIMLGASINLVLAATAAEKAMAAKLKVAAIDGYLASDEAKAAGIVNVSKADRDLAELEARRAARAIARQAAVAATQASATPAPAPVVAETAPIVNAVTEPAV